MSKNKVIIIGLVAAALVATIVINKQKPAEVSANPESQSLFVDATKISSEFKENKTTALESYKDKTVEITGLVKQIDKTVGSENIVFVSSSDAFEVKGKFSNKSEVEKLANVNSGQNIVVKCIGESTESSFAEFKDCTLVSSVIPQAEPAKAEVSPAPEQAKPAEQPAVAEPAVTAPANSNPATNN
jgi:hypothetical protein